MAEGCWRRKGSRSMHPVTDSSRSGQVMIEYILIMAMILGVMLGIFAGIFQPYMERIQQELEERTATVVAQDTLGIPLQWFLGEDRGFDSVGQKLADAQTGVAQGTSGGGGSGSGGSGPVNGPGGSGGGGDGGAGSNQPQGSNSSLGNTADSKKGGGGSSESLDSESGFKKKGGKSAGSSESSTNPTEDLKTNSQDDRKDDGGSSEGKDQDAESTGDAYRTKREFTQEQRARSGGGCADMNLFTLLKIGAVLGLILLGAAVLVTAKGQKGSD